MKTCNLSDFMKALTPWLDDAYIRKACLNDKGHFVLTVPVFFAVVPELEKESLGQALLWGCLYGFFTYAT